MRFSFIGTLLGSKAFAQVTSLLSEGPTSDLSAFEGPPIWVSTKGATTIDGSVMPVETTVSGLTSSSPPPSPTSSVEGSESEVISSLSSSPPPSTDASSSTASASAPGSPGSSASAAGAVSGSATASPAASASPSTGAASRTIGADIVPAAALLVLLPFLL